MRRARRWLRALLVLGLSAALGVAAASLYVEHRYVDRIVPQARAPHAPVALVYGAGLAPGGVPSPVLAQRLDAALALYHGGKVEALLLSGDNSDRFHVETHAMAQYVRDRGVPDSAIQQDTAGLSTYDSSVRARSIFGVRRALLVTQRFHLTRALYIANSVGIDAWGVAADESSPRTRRYALRETLSRVLALGMVWADAPPATPPDRPRPLALSAPAGGQARPRCEESPGSAPLGKSSHPGVLAWRERHAIQEARSRRRG